ncbi:MAG: bifunctional oligoribonuclease/PAP phosphatase NrnA [Clostridiales bacterium]|nr:bifunctional oligoribonuclease/PAP phosphatase NrnA [Clostridiales bacterium]
MTMFDVFAKTLKESIIKAETIVLSAHINADGDAVGSVMAADHYIRSLGKAPYTFVSFKGTKFDRILKREYITEPKDAPTSPDLFISLDCGDKNRLGEGKALFENSKATINIDHHISNTNFAEHNLVCPKASSTCELVYELLSRLNDIDTYTAECLYTGLLTDTCAFKHSSTGKRTMEIAGELMAKGIDFTDIQADMLYRHDFTAAKVFAKAVSNMELKDGIAYTTLTLKEIRSCGAIFEQLDGIAEYCLNTIGAVCSVFLYEKAEKTIKCSFRSTGVDVNKAASSFGGGGHICAAGCTIEGFELNEALEKCLNALRNEINENNGN